MSDKISKDHEGILEFVQERKFFRIIPYFGYEDGINLVSFELGEKLFYNKHLRHEHFAKRIVLYKPKNTREGFKFGQIIKVQNPNSNSAQDFFLHVKTYSFGELYWNNEWIEIDDDKLVTLVTTMSEFELDFNKYEFYLIEYIFCMKSIDQSQNSSDDTSSDSKNSYYAVLSNLPIEKNEFYTSRENDINYTCIKLDTLKTITK